MKFRSDHIENKSKLIQVKNALIFQKGAPLWNVRHGQGRESWKQPEAVFLVMCDIQHNDTLHKGLVCDSQHNRHLA